MTYPRVESPGDLPPAGPPSSRTREKLDIDFKAFADEKKHFEHAKDIASFANARGGVLLVGATDENGPLEYPGLKNQTIAAVKSIYEGAAMACSPPAVVDVIPVEHAPGIWVVAINVDPHLDQAMGSPTGSVDPATKLPIKPGVGWIFPNRLASQSGFVTPEILPMYMSREIRRTILLLAKIPEASRTMIKLHYRTRLSVSGGGFTLQMADREMTFVDVDLEKNRVRFVGAGSMQVNVPILDVVDVWESDDGRWEVRVTGEIRERKGGTIGNGYVYTPLYV